MIGPLLLLACTMAPDPKWTVEGAILPARVKLDTNRDGRVTVDEYTRVAFSAPDFAQVDTDDDGDISIGELRTLVLATDPSRFFERPRVHVPGKARDGEALDAQANARPPHLVGGPEARGPQAGLDAAGAGPDVAGSPRWVADGPDAEFGRRGGPVAQGGPGAGGPGGLGQGGLGGPGGVGGPRQGGAGGPGAGRPGGAGPGGPGGPGAAGEGPGRGVPNGPMSVAGGAGPAVRGPDAGPPGGARGGPVHPSKPGPKPRPDAYYVLLILRAEVISVDPAANVPSEEALRRIGLNEPLDGPEAIRALGELEDAATALHLDFPAGLRRGREPGP